MSKIAITLSEKELDSALLVQIKRLTQESLSAIKCKVENKEPLFSGVLFYNDHEELSILFKKIIHLLDKQGLAYSIYELDEEATTIEEQHKITKDILFRILSLQSE